MIEHVEVEHDNKHVVEEQVAQLVVEVEQLAQPLKRQRKYSERITELTLKRIAITTDGYDLSMTKPVTLE